MKASVCGIGYGKESIPKTSKVSMGSPLRE